MWGQLAGAALGAIGGSKGQKGGGGTPKFVKRQIKRGYEGLNAATSRTAAESIAPRNADQLRAADMVRSNIGLGGADMGLALAAQRRAAGGVTGADINGFMNPYENTVVRNAIGDIERSRDINMLGINAQAEAASAFGGDREAVAKALAAEDYNRNIATTAGSLRYGGYQSALDAAFRNNDAISSGGTALAQTVDDQRRQAYGDAAALGAVGDTSYAYDQNLLDYPLRMAQMQVDAGTAGLGAQRPGATTGGGISGAMAGAAGGYDMFGKLFG